MLFGKQMTPIIRASDEIYNVKLIGLKNHKVLAGEIYNVKLIGLKNHKVLAGEIYNVKLIGLRNHKVLAGKIYNVKLIGLRNHKVLADKILISLLLVKSTKRTCEFSPNNDMAFNENSPDI